MLLHGKGVVRYLWNAKNGHYRYGFGKFSSHIGFDFDGEENGCVISGGIFVQFDDNDSKLTLFAVNFSITIFRFSKVSVEIWKIRL